MRSFGCIIVFVPLLISCNTTDTLKNENHITQLTEGRTLFVENCAACHGNDLKGTPQGPPLIWDLYTERHHPDLLIKKAITTGVTQHHWPFGNMPAVENINEQQVDNLVYFVRHTLRANGVH